jgi:hypothetical protein
VEKRLEQPSPKAAESGGDRDPRLALGQSLTDVLLELVIVGYWPLGAVTLNRLRTATIEGTTDQNVVHTAVDRRAEAAAVNAIASGSQHSTMRAISHRMSHSASVSAELR